MCADPRELEGSSGERKGNVSVLRARVAWHIGRRARCGDRRRISVAQGHTLVVPRRHCADVFELTPAEFEAVWSVVRELRDELHARLRPDGFTIGVNAGEAAGQTVAHAHVHVIPRFHGDVPDPRGGVRWVIPQRAAYWEAPQR